MKLLPMKFALLASTLVLGAPATVFAESGPFGGLAGSWVGGGTVAMADGSSERLRCKASYSVGEGGSSVQQALRCASDSYKFDISSAVTSRDGNISGSWSESSRNVSGNLEGRAGAGQLTAQVQAAGFVADVHMTTRGNRQSVSISSPGEFRNVSVNLVRG